MKRFLWLGLALAVCAGCAKKAAQEGAPERDIGPEAQAYYKAHPDFFHFKTIDDLPKDLVWHDGHEVAEFADPEAKRGGTFRAYNPDFPRTFRLHGPDSADPFRSFLFDEVDIGLIGQQPDTGQYYPGLARQWAYGADGRTMYFRLDPDARYSDGVPVRADDFLFSYFFLHSPYLLDPFGGNYIDKTIEQITKYDDLTISISLKEAKPDIEDRLNTVPTPEHFYKEFGPDYVQRYQWRVEPTTGPYTVRPEDVHKGESVDLTRVPNWWADDRQFYRHRYNPDRIHFVVVRDPDKVFEAFKRGDLDTVDLLRQRPQAWYTTLADSDPLVRAGAVAKVQFYYQCPQPSYAFNLNCSDSVLANRDVREGIAYASNFDLVDKQYYRGDWQRMQTSSDGFAEVPFPNIHPRPFSVDNALACFAKAGFVRRGPDGILVNDRGQRLSFTVTCPYERMRDPLTILRQEAAKAGLELKIEILDLTTAYKKIDEKHHQIAFAALNVPSTKYPDYWQSFDSSNANRPTTNNWTDTADPEMDKLITAYDRARTMDEVRKIAQQIEARIYSNAAFIPAFEAPYFRVAYWRWVRFPKAFSTRVSNEAAGEGTLDGGLFWIDDSMRPKVEAALKGGEKLPVEIKVYDQWKQN